MNRKSINAPPNGGPDDEWLDVNGAAKVYFRGKVRVVRGHVARNTLPFKKFGSRVYFSRRELDEFLRALPGCTLAEACENLAMRN